MNFILIIILLIIGGFLGIIIQASYRNIRRRRNKSKSLMNSSVPEKIEFSEKDYKLLAIEWKTTIETQMHFNDLIIKFRSIVLSIFIGTLGIIYGLTKQIKLQTVDIYVLIGLSFTFWICCFVLDFFYYHRLLLGSVGHSRKFDNNEILKKKGLFGLTSRINNEINPGVSKILIWIFYLLPMFAITLAIILRQSGLLK